MISTYCFEIWISPLLIFLVYKHNTYIIINDVMVYSSLYKIHYIVSWNIINKTGQTVNYILYVKTSDLCDLQTGKGKIQKSVIISLTYIYREMIT